MYLFFFVFFSVFFFSFSFFFVYDLFCHLHYFHATDRLLFVLSLPLFSMSQTDFYLFCHFHYFPCHRQIFICSVTSIIYHATEQLTEPLLIYRYFKKLDFRFLTPPPPHTHTHTKQKREREHPSLPPTPHVPSESRL